RRRTRSCEGRPSRGIRTTGCRTTRTVDEEEWDVQTVYLSVCRLPLADTYTLPGGATAIFWRWWRNSMMRVSEAIPVGRLGGWLKPVSFTPRGRYEDKDPMGA